MIGDRLNRRLLRRPSIDAIPASCLGSMPAMIKRLQRQRQYLVGIGTRARSQARAQ
jgi:hypothetical protein